MIANREWRPIVDPELRELCGGEELEVVGVYNLEPDAPAEREHASVEYREWLERGYHGTMAYMERHEMGKWDPGLLLPGARSIVFVALNYYQKRGDRPPAAGRVARYAWGRDYHKELGGRLRRIARILGDRYPHERFRSFTDATPLAERWYAERSGIGFTGRNTLLINGTLGSWFVIGEILSTKHYERSESAFGRHGACLTSCRKCIDVCPTGALYADGRIDASRCISYLTIEHDGIIPEEQAPLIGDWIFGCDLCQEVCPLNVRARPTRVERFLKPIAGEYLPLAEILSIRDDAEFTRRFAGSPLMRAKRRRLVRNAIVVASNLGAGHLAPRIGHLARDDDAIIAHHARKAYRDVSI